MLGAFAFFGALGALLLGVVAAAAFFLDGAGFWGAGFLGGGLGGGFETAMGGAVGPLSSSLSVPPFVGDRGTISPILLYVDANENSTSLRSNRFVQ